MNLVVSKKENIVQCIEHEQVKCHYKYQNIRDLKKWISDIVKLSDSSMLYIKESLEAETGTLFKFRNEKEMFSQLEEMNNSVHSIENQADLVGVFELNGKFNLFQKGEKVKNEMKLLEEIDDEILVYTFEERQEELSELKKWINSKQLLKDISNQ